MKRGLEVPKVQDILTKKVIAFRPDFSTLDAIKGFNQFRISSAPVVNESNEVVGFLSEGDSIKCLGNCLFYDESRNRTVKDIMTKEVEVADPNWDLFELENFFISKHLRTAPVVDSDNHLVGIVTRRDALRALEKVLQTREEYKESIKTRIELNLHERMKIIARM